MFKAEEHKTLGWALQNGTMVQVNPKQRERQTVKWRNNVCWSGTEDSKASINSNKIKTEINLFMGFPKDH